MNSFSISKSRLKAFSQEVRALGIKTYQNLEYKDFKHLKKVEFYGRLATFGGLLTAWISVNPVSVVLIAIGIMVRWLLMHHISHGGYDKVPGVPTRYTSKYFAKGYRRFIDWFDWIDPTAWAYEHNFLHHYYTGEPIDPDIPEINSKILRKLKLPLFIKYFLIGVSSLTWKYTYYAANTLNGLESKGKGNLKHIYHINPKNFLNFNKKIVRTLWFKCLLPYGLFNFLLLPMVFYPLGMTAVKFVLINRILAELLINFHTFVIIVTNHAGDDLYRYNDHYQNKDEFYLRQVIGSVNFNGGTNFKDFFLMYLNYQIEHHVFPDLPMNKYREIAPRLQEICLRYEIPYIKESIFSRWKKLYENMAGKNSMKVYQTKSSYQVTA